MASDGNNFGLNGSYEYNEFEIDSFDALAAYDNAYPITNWPRIYFGKPLDNIVAVKVLEATIPFTFYTINSTNNTFTLAETAPAVSYTATITPGTYTSNLFCDALVSALQAVSSKSYTCYQDSTNLKLYIEIDVGTFSITVGTALNSPAKIMGLTPSATTSSSGTILTTPFVAQLNGSPYLYLNSSSLGSAVNIFLNGDGIVNATGTGADGPQLCMIPINASFGENIIYKDPDPQKWFYLGTQNMQGTLDFYLTQGVANQNIPLELNGAGFSIKLGLLQSKMTGNEQLPSTQQNHRVISRTWQAGGNRMLF